MPWVEGVEEEKKKRDFEIAFERAWDELCKRELGEVARLSKATLNEEERSLTLKFLGNEYKVKPEEKAVLTAEGNWTNPFYAFLIVHYLVGAKDIPLANELISFRELYGGDVYYLAFKNRAIEVVKDGFESQPEKLVQNGIRMGGEKAEMGDCSVTIPVFPKIPVTIIIWLGDEEVPTSANILFDKTAGEHLHTEDIAAICEEMARRLLD